jgi:hypothetical protein
MERLVPILSTGFLALALLVIQEFSANQKSLNALPIPVKTVLPALTALIRSNVCALLAIRALSVRLISMNALPILVATVPSVSIC